MGVRTVEPLMTPRITNAVAIWFAAAGLLLTACGDQVGRSAGSGSGEGETTPGPDTPTSAPASEPASPSASPQVDDPSVTPSLQEPTAEPLAPARGPSNLTITVVDAPGLQARSWTLSCHPVGGTHPDPEAACAALMSGPFDPFEPIPLDVVCTQIYGGSQTAVIKGIWDGSDVEARFSREDGCEIARWDRLAPVFGMPLPPVRE